MSHVSDICIHTHTQEYLRAEHAARFEVGCVVTVQKTFTPKFNPLFKRVELTEGTKGELMEIEKRTWWGLENAFKIKWQDGSTNYVHQSESLNITCPAAQVCTYYLFEGVTLNTPLRFRECLFHNCACSFSNTYMYVYTVCPAYANLKPPPFPLHQPSFMDLHKGRFHID